MQQLVVSCSLSPGSHSRVMALSLVQKLEALGDKARLVDLLDLDLPFCDGKACYDHPNVMELQAAVKEASAITIATPIYNFETGGATRNLVALGSDAWKEKIVGFLCAAGGANSYMSVMSLANSLMLDFRCMIIPRFVYATGNSFSNGRLVDLEVEKRIGELAGDLRRVALALAP